MKTRTLRQTVLLPASPAAVYHALTDSWAHSAFTGSKAKIAKRAGGRMTAGTRLTMIHSEVPASQASRYAGGWRAFYGTPLRRYLKQRSAK